MDEAPSRQPPHSLELESQLLSCCLDDVSSSDTLNRCLGANLSSKSFYDPCNQVIYGKLIDLLGEGKPADLTVLCDALKSAGKLEFVGGYAKLVEITKGFSTTAQVPHFIGRILEMHALREVIKTTAQITEDCYSYSGGGVSEMLSEPVSRLLELSSGATDKPEPPWASVVDEAQKVLDNLISHHGMPQADIIEFPWPAMNNLFQPMQRGQLVVVGARSSVGKSSFARQVACGAARNGLKVYFDTLEVKPVQVALQMAAMASHVGLRRIPQAHQKDQEDFRAALSGLREAGIVMSSRDKTLAQFVCRVKALKASKKVDIAILDYGGLLWDVATCGADEMVPTIGRVSKVLKGLAMDEKIVVMMLWQLNRKSDNDGNREPRLSDFRGSGNIEEDSDKCILLHRPTQEPLSGQIQDGKSCEELPTYFQTITQAKGRDDGVAKMEFGFDRATTSFHPWAKQEQPPQP
jgi:replicative DNA helicase